MAWALNDTRQAPICVLTARSARALRHSGAGAP